VPFYPTADPETTTTVQRLRARFPDAVLDVADHRGDLAVRVPRERLVEVLCFLRDDAETSFDMLLDICGVDWLGREPRFDVVYHLRSLARNHRVRVKAAVPEDDPVVDSLTPRWTGADWFERECYDLFGILFRGHPFLRRILTHDEFQGHALRKDYDQRQRWRCTRVSDLESTVAVPAPRGADPGPALPPGSAVGSAP
jgi:NADH/F420H2 dehydrogenase subunit C